jgi:hypothetical protein
MVSFEGSAAAPHRSPRAPQPYHRASSGLAHPADSTPEYPLARRRVLRMGTSLPIVGRPALGARKPLRLVSRAVLCSSTPRPLVSRPALGARKPQPLVSRPVLGSRTPPPLVSRHVLHVNHCLLYQDRGRFTKSSRPLRRGAAFVNRGGAAFTRGTLLLPQSKGLLTRERPPLQARTPLLQRATRLLPAGRPLLSGGYPILVARASTGLAQRPRPTSVAPGTSTRRPVSTW